MHWESLFDDLESQLELELAADEVGVIAEEERLRIGRLTLRDRIRAMVAVDARLTATVRGGDRISLAVSAIGRDWIAGDLEGATGRSGVIPIGAVSGLLPSATQLEAARAPIPIESPTELSARLGLAFVLRDLCRKRSPVDLVHGESRRHGTIDRVGRDHLDLAEHPVGEPRRASAVTRIVVLPLADIVLVRF